MSFLTLLVIPTLPICWFYTTSRVKRARPEANSCFIKCISRGKKWILEKTIFFHGGKRKKKMKEEEQQLMKFQDDDSVLCRRLYKKRLFDSK